MTDYYIVAAALGLGLAAVILFLVRRDHLYLRDGLFWIAIAMGSIILGVWPSLVDVLGVAVGVAYPPALLFLIAILVLVVRALKSDIAVTQIKRELRRLNQRMALYEAEGARKRET
ncbi:MAG: DUF2304 domain-containing protein [Hydrogenophilales bacterium]|nr:DUF2304 domain-containing protein [Hydrogenophilales bacterium]